MQIGIQSSDFPLTDALRNHTKRRLGFALSARDNHIQRVIVRLSDSNGPRSGADKYGNASGIAHPVCTTWNR